MTNHNYFLWVRMRPYYHGVVRSSDIILGKFSSANNQTMEKLKKRVDGIRHKLPHCSYQTFSTAEQEIAKDSDKLQSIGWDLKLMQLQIDSKNPVELLDDPKTYLALFARDAAKDLGIEVAPAPPEEDGPYGIDQWVHKGGLIERKMVHASWKLAEYLYKRIGRRVEISDLVKDRGLFSSIEDSTVQRHGSRASEWFAKHKVPLKIASGDGLIWMELISDN